MQYWNEFFERFGFCKGTNYPKGVVQYREVYCRAVNKLAENEESNCRVLPINVDDSTHNQIQIIVVSKDYYEKMKYHLVHPDALPEMHKQHAIVEPDQSLQFAISRAFDQKLDKFIVFTPSIDLNFESFLNRK